MKFWKTFWLVATPYAVLMMLFKGISSNFTSSAIIGVVVSSVFFGVTFTLAMQWFTRYQMKRIVIMLDPHEKLVKEGGATHRVKLEGVGGKLALTDKRLIFKSHKLNIQNHEQAFQLVGIHSVEAGKTGFLKNLLLVKLSDGTTEKFIVFEPDEWVREIKSGLSMVSA